MTPFDAVLLGIVEGVSEFLPISSTGHLILASSLLGIEQSEFVKTFEIAIQCGAILAVLVLYWKSFLNWQLLKKIVVAFIPTALIGLALYKVVKAYLIGNEMVVLLALLIGGIALIAFERAAGSFSTRLAASHSDGGPKELGNDSAAVETSITYKQAALIGVAQTVAIIPGVSRSAATIVGGLWLGVSRVAIVEFSFLLAVPTMVAATGLDLLKTGFALSSNEWFLLFLGFVLSFVVALASLRWLLAYVRTHSFVAFGVYRIILSLVFFAFLFY